MRNITSGDELYLFLRETKSKLLANMIFSDSPGHQVYELDYFLRKYLSHTIDRETKYYWVHRGGAIPRGMADTFGAAFSKYNLEMIASDEMFAMANEVCRMVPEFGVDIGLGHIRNSVMSRENTFVQTFHYRLHYHVTNDEVVRQCADHYRLRTLTAAHDPWAEARPKLDGPMADLLGNKLDKIAVLHFRVGTGNAGVAIPPENLLPSLEYLADNGYTLVKAGTEPAPDEFNRFNIINYSATPLRSFKNDLALLSNAKFCMINASGLENIADVMGVPTVSYARWHLSMFPYSPKTIIVPALMYDPARDRMLTFGEQMLLFKTMPEYWESKNFVWHVPIDRFKVIPPRADELLAATKEALELGAGPKPWSQLQQRFRALDGSGLLSTAEARVSQFFLERFQSHL